MKKNNWLVVALSLLVVCVACEKDDPKVDPSKDDSINEWIYSIMDTHYLWNNSLPAKNTLNMSQDPEKFFKSLLSEKDGKYINNVHYYFSTIEKKDTDTKTIRDGEPTYGFEFALYQPDDERFVYALVLYVLPGSPAYKAGLKRGNFIVGTGEGKVNNITDYNVLESGGEVVFNLAKYDPKGNGKLISDGSLKIGTAYIVENTPFLKDTVLNIRGKNIGYLAYNHFSSGPDGSNDKAWDNQMKEIFTNFKTKQVDEFVLDLRYNGGGLVSSSKLMSSYLAPSEALGDIFAFLKYNEKNSKNNSIMYFEKASSVAGANLNLNRLYVLTGMQTASASEAVINMLIPYLGRDKIKLIGNKTIGKNVGSNTFGEKQNYGYLLHPITLRIYNKEEEADYDDGFEPDIYLDELKFGQPMYELGEPEELLLSTAIQDMTGGGRSVSKSSLQDNRTQLIYQSLDRRGVKGLIIDLDN